MNFGDTDKIYLLARQIYLRYDIISSRLSHKSSSVCSHVDTATAAHKFGGRR